MRKIWLFPFLLCLLIDSAVAVAVPVASPPSPSRYLSHTAECEALLQFSRSFIVTRNVSGDYCPSWNSSISPHLKTALLKAGTDCCSWDGVTCDRGTNSVIGLDLSCSWLQGVLYSNSTLFSLPKLLWLNLAGNNFYSSQVSSRFGIFTGMVDLNLSCSFFSGHVPPEISHLSNLTTLDLSQNYNLKIGDHSFRSVAHNLTQLRELVLDFVNMSRISPVSLCENP